MSVSKFFVAGDGEQGYELSAETTSNALEPVGEVYRGQGEKRSLVDSKEIDEGLAQALIVAALCNVAS
jgi:hypothetical protein